MLGHYLLIAFRILMRNRVYAAITVCGLALGIAGCVLILDYIRYETSYDRWLPDSDRIFQVQATTREPGQPITRSQDSPFPVRDALAAGFPQIEAISVVRTGPAPVVRAGAPVFIDSASVDPSFFRIFRLPFVHGNPVTALADTRNIVLTRREAIAQFGSDDVVGRTVTLGAGAGKQDYRVGGVIADLPGNTSLKLALIFRYDPAMTDGWPAADKGWGAMSQMHVVRLRAGADAAAINAALPGWEKRIIPTQDLGGRKASQADNLSLELVPISAVHLGAAQQGALVPGGDPRTLATFAIIALLTLGMAVMNFVNLSTARVMPRAREIALRKVFGATRRQIVVQLLGESLVMTSLATLLGFAVAELSLPWVAHWTGATLAMRYLGADGMLMPAIALAVATGLAGGVYPALFLSRFRPGLILRANRASLETPSSGRLRATLVAVQFAIAIGFVACTSVIWSQTRFLAMLDPGYRRDGMVQLSAAWRFAGSGEFDAARPQLLAIPGVANVGRTNLGLAATNKSIVTVRAPGKPADLAIGRYAVDTGFFDAMGMRLIAGRSFDDRFGNDRIARQDGGTPVDPTHPVNVVVNRTAAAALGDTDPEQAVGRAIRVGIDGELVAATIVGVVEDTRIRTTRDTVEPLIYTDDPLRTDQVIVRYANADPAATMAAIGKVWQRFEPEIPFQARFGEDILAELYAADRARAALFAGFSLLAIVIACLGLYSLAAFATERRTKEIGIRKVLGAKVRDIVRLLAWQFSKPVVMANLIAWPVAWAAMRDWLNGFDARIALTPAPFAVAGIATLIIALGTVAGHAIRVAKTSPINALRYE